jgi:GMP synthase (glutamine-hydrolysing)
MKVAILQCDTVLEKFQPEFGQYSTMIRHMFDAFDAEFEFDIYDCQKGDYPGNPDRYDFFITTGSKAGVYEDKPWIRQLITFIRQLDKQKRKLIGICFGHQLIAIARNGKVEKSLKGWGVGIAHNRVVATPEWMSEKSSTLDIIVSHQDQIVDLPHDTLVIAESDFCPYFVVQWGNHFLSIQGHPEWNNDYSRTLINDRRDRIPKDRVDSGLCSLARQPDNTRFINWLLDFVRHSH